MKTFNLTRAVAAHGRMIIPSKHLKTIHQNKNKTTTSQIVSTAEFVTRHKANSVFPHRNKKLSGLLDKQLNSFILNKKTKHQRANKLKRAGSVFKSRKLLSIDDEELDLDLNNKNDFKKEKIGKIHKSLNKIKNKIMNKRKIKKNYNKDVFYQSLDLKTQNMQIEKIKNLLNNSEHVKKERTMRDLSSSTTTFTTIPTTQKITTTTSVHIPIPII
jgi:hypothetical protein